MDRALLDAMGVPPEAAEAILALQEAEQTWPPMLTGLPELRPPLAVLPGRDALAAMTPEEINRCWDTVQEVLRS